MSESAFWKSLKTTLKKENVTHQRFEDMLSEGIPDLCLFVNKKTIWIELKYKKLPKRESTKIKVGIRPAQRIWIRKAKKVNIPCFVLTKFDNGDILFHKSDFIDGLYFGMDKDELYKQAEYFKDNKSLIEYIKGVTK